MGSTSQDDTLPEVQAFLQWVPTHLLPGVASPDAPHQDFVPYPDLEAYFTENGNERLKAIVAELCPAPTHYPSQTTKYIVENEYIRGFATLLMIGEGRHIEQFVEEDALSDVRLPFTTRPDAFPYSTQGDSFEKFRKQQWIFLPATIEARQKHMEVERILPILNQTPLGAGGSAQVSLIELHPFYNRLMGSRKPPSPFLPQNNTFVLKTYHPLEAQAYHDETKAFKHLRNQPYLNVQSFITYYGSFEQTNTSSEKTFNIILEYADGGDLEAMFQNEEEPSTPKEIATFWLRLLDILQALRAIHTIKVDGNRGNAFLNGWHQDVKPKNIFIARHGRHLWDSDFKLADLGLAHFRPRVGGQAGATDRQGTKTYGAPECYREDTFSMRAPRTVDSSVDCWSLGAVLCETMIWILGGLKALNKFREQKRSETNSIPGHQDTGAFHDSNGAILPCVKSRLESIESDIRNGDKVTFHVLKLVQECMLVPFDSRPNAGHIWSRWQKLRLGIEQFINGDSDSVLPTPRSPPHQGRTLPSHATGSTPPNQAWGSPIDQQIAPSSSQSPPTEPAPDLIARVAPPSWPRHEADQWLYDHISNSQGVFDDSLASELAGRDHVFLIDNSGTMRSHWREVVSTVQLLSEILFTLRADDKIEVELAVKRDGRCSKKKSKDLRDFVEAHKPPDVSYRQLNLGDALADYLHEYQSAMLSRRFSLSRRGKKPLSLYILTDGRYQQYSDMKQPIRDILQTLAQRAQQTPSWNRPRKYVGIQLIQFGANPEGTFRLEELDKFTRVEQLWSDIVDTEPADGNVWKMLLGAINDTFDDDGAAFLSTAPTGLTEDPFVSPARTRTHAASSASTFGAPLPDRTNTGATVRNSTYRMDSIPSR